MLRSLTVRAAAPLLPAALSLLALCVCFPGLADENKMKENEMRSEMRQPEFLTLRSNDFLVTLTSNEASVLKAFAYHSADLICANCYILIYNRNINSGSLAKGSRPSCTGHSIKVDDKGLVMTSLNCDRLALFITRYSHTGYYIHYQVIFIRCNHFSLVHVWV